MKITGDDFVELAGNLAANSAFGGSEARFRTAVSRAYYGAFHCAVGVLNELGVRVPQNHTGHVEAYRKLRHCPVSFAMDAASLLDGLRSDRIEADYDLNRLRFSKQINAQLCVESALDAIRNLRECLNEPWRTQLADYFSAHA